MPRGTWVCDGCDTNNEAGATTCRLCRRPPGSTTAGGVQVLAGDDRRPQRPSSAAQLSSWHGGPQAGVGPPGSSMLYVPAPPAPVPPAPDSRPAGAGSPWLWLGGLLVVVLALALALMVGRLSVGSDAADADAGTPPPAVATQDTAQEPPTPVTPEQALAGTRDADRATIESDILDHWVPQLASNIPGTDVTGRYWDTSAIWQEHQRLRQQFGALLYRSEDYVSRHDGYWVSIAPATFSTAEDALSWCVTNGLDADHCYAKFVTHDPSVYPNYQYQR